MIQELRGPGTGLLGEWVGALRRAAERVGLGRDVVPIRGSLGGAMLVACVRKLGGSVEPLEPFHGWIVADRASDAEVEQIWDAAPELRETAAGIRDFHGVVAIRLDGRTFLALRTDEPLNCHGECSRVLVLAGASREATLELASRLAAARLEVLASRRVAVFGSRTRLVDTTPVTEADLILAPDFKVDLLGFFDGFARAAEICRRIRVSPSRGALLVGAPGTGKTQTVRHLFARLEAARFFVFSLSMDDGWRTASHHFCNLLDAVNESAAPAVVVIEDVDRLFELGEVSPQFFLNVLDGLFRPRQPVLWVATSNDPRALEQNLLDRPGRFDRVFVFSAPGAAERAALFRRYSPWPIETSTLEELADRTDGLTAAHIREIALAAALACAEEPARFGSVLREEVMRVRGQHDRARRYDFDLGERRMGFAR